MIHKRRSVSRRAIAGLGLGLWIILLVFATLRGRADGPQWGVYVALSPDGRAVAAAIDPQGEAWGGGLRQGDEITAVGADSPQLFVGRDVPSVVQELTVRDADGALRTIGAWDIPMSLLVMLVAGAFLFVVLGSAVYRWSADAGLGRLFLLLSGSFATALVASPSARLGYAWAGYLTAAAALLAAPALFGLFLSFPRPMRFSSRLAGIALLPVIPLTIAEVAGPALGRNAAALFDNASWLWMMLNLLGAVALLTFRASRPSDRRALLPLLIGTAVGVGPLVVLVAIPKLLGLPQSIAPEIAGIAMAAIPISFAYSILRYQVLGLDVLVRRVLLRASNALVGTVLFFTCWKLLQAVGLPETEAGLLAGVVAALSMPSVSAWVAIRLDAWLYRPLFSLRSQIEPLRGDSLESLGVALAVHLRQLLPIYWAACVIQDATVPVDQAARRLLGSDGQIPAWLDAPSTLEQRSTEVREAPIHRFTGGVVLLLAGPRLDGAHLDGIQCEALDILARAVGATFEAALLREGAEEEARFRQGLTEMARDLAAAATVNDVLRCFATHAERLLTAQSASLFRAGPGGEVAL